MRQLHKRNRFGYVKTRLKATSMNMSIRSRSEGCINTTIVPPMKCMKVY